MGQPCIKKDALCRCRLAGVNVSTDSYIAIATDWGLTCHDIFLLLKTQKGS